MVDLGCQGTDLVGGNDKDDSMQFYYEIASFWPLLAGTKENVVILGAFLVALGSQGGP